MNCPRLRLYPDLRRWWELHRNPDFKINGMSTLNLVWVFPFLITLCSCGQVVQTTQQNFKITSKDSVQLATTFTRPAGLSQTPLIILIHGSGNDNRQNPYYQLLTKEFCDIGFSVIAYDKRGCDNSTGNWLTVPFSCLKDDVLSIVNHFAADTTITKIGLWGGSEGSNVAVWAATENKDVDFVIAQSFTAMTFAEQNKYVKSQSLKRYRNVSQQETDDLMKLQDLLYEFVRTGKGYSDYIQFFNRFRNRDWFAEILGQPVNEYGQWSKWYKTKLDIESTEFTRKLMVPTLFIWGGRDPLIEVNKSMALVKASNQSDKLRFKIFDHADHSLYAGGRKPEHLKYMKEWLTTIAN